MVNRLLLPVPEADRIIYDGIATSRSTTSPEN